MAQQAKLSTKQIAAFLGAVPLFAGCSKRDLKLLADIARVVSYAEGEMLCEEGADGLGLSVITQGEAAVIVHGRRRRVMGEGAFFGEISLLDGGPRSATVRASTPVTCVEVPTWGFRAILREEPRLSLKMLEAICRRIREDERG